jgi:hypothetical protein
MTKALHVTQADFGFWQLSLEEADGSLRLLAHRTETVDHLIENARELVADQMRRWSWIRRVRR